MIDYCLPFREFTFHSNRGEEYPRAFSEVDPDSRRKEAREKPKRENRRLQLDLRGAVRAEMSVQLWGGHIGTSGQRFRVNDSEWIALPQPENTPGPPELYHRTLVGDHNAALPLDRLKNGENIFQFTCGPQIKYSFDWGFYWIYSFTVRIYYDPMALDSSVTPAGCPVGSFRRLSRENASGNTLYSE